MAHGQAPPGDLADPASSPSGPAGDGPEGSGNGAARGPVGGPLSRAAASDLTLRLVLAAVLLLVVLATIRSAVPATRWGSGPWHRHGVALGIGLEIVLAVLLGLVLYRDRRIPPPGQPATSLRLMLKTVLIAGLVTIPILLFLVAAKAIKPHPPKVTAPTATISPSLPRHLHVARHGGGLDLALLLYLLLALVLVGGVAVVILLLRRRSRMIMVPVEDDLLDDGGESAEQLRQAVRSGRAALDEIDDARLAIIACYAAMEQSLGRAGAARGEAETPDELLVKVAAAGLAEGAEAGRLTRLFYEARFSTHPLPAAYRDEARAALGVIGAQLHDKIAQRAAAAAAAAAAGEDSR